MWLFKILFRSFGKLISHWNIYIIKSLAYDLGERQQLPVNLDYVRHKTLELCCAEIKRNNIKGNVAELGVYKGDFAIKINVLFSDRKLYLFDTFSGFNTNEIENDKLNFSTFHQDFTDTSIEFVKKRMQHPDQCIFKKGYFPETTADVDDNFCFVSIDADLYEPIQNGLNYFFPRLQKGGYIFVHDFTNKHFKGARKAVMEFCRSANIHYVPIPDTGGSVIITK